jgi:hypothetical protein
MHGPGRGVLREEPSASIAHARVCEGRGRRGYGHPYSGTKPETVDTCQGAAYGCDRPLLLGDRREPEEVRLHLASGSVVLPRLRRGETS